MRLALPREGGSHEDSPRTLRGDRPCGAAGAGADAAGPAAAAQPPPTPPPADPQEPPIYEEQVVVTASKVEQQLVNAPATVSVITSDVIESSPATNYAELLRSVPGMNITQTSARDFNINMRGATSTLATSQLALIDGRSLYLDFFGFVAWDFLPVNPNEVRQIEVIRGPASAIWGANALSGVVNFITKTPRELAGSSFTIGVGTFGREVNDNGRGNGALWYINGTHAAAANDRWAYKLSAGWLRPGRDGPPGRDDSQRAQHAVSVVRQHRHAPAEVRHPRRLRGAGRRLPAVVRRRLRRHRGHHPHRHRAVRHEPRHACSATARRAGPRARRRSSFFTNILNGDANALLSVGLDGQPILFEFNTKTFDVEYGNVNALGTRNVLSYGGNFRYNSFDLSLAPRGDNRTEGGVYVQDEIFINDHLRWVVGARARQVQRARRPELLAADRVHRQGRARSRRPLLVQPRLPRPVADQQLPRRRHLQPARPADHQPGVRRGPGRPDLHLPVPGRRQRRAGRAAGGRLRGGLHRRHRQARDGDRGLLLQRVEGRHLLHADRPLPGLSPPPGWVAKLVAGGRAGAVARHPRSAAAAVHVAGQPSARSGGLP